MAPVADAGRFAAACAALRLDVDVVPAEGAGVAAVVRSGEDADAAVQALSRLLGRADVLLLRRAEGQVTAERWRGGALQDAPAAGLLLSGLPDAVERLVLTDDSALAEPGAVSSVGLPRGRGLRSALALQRAGADPAVLARARRIDLVSSVAVAVVLAVLLVLEVPRALQGNGSWVIVVLALAALAWVGWRIAGSLRRGS